MGCVITWVTWVRGSNFYMGWVRYVGQNIFTWVIIFAWVKYIFVWVFEWVQNFCVGFFLLRESAFFTRWDYFSILQLINWAFFLWVSSQKILTRPCFIPLVFLSGFLEICKIDEIQWHFYVRVTKFYLWAANWPYSQRGCKYNQILRSPPDSSSPFWKFCPFMEAFSRKKLSERMLYHALNRVFRLLHSYTKISNIFCKINYDSQRRQVFS